MPTDGMSQLTYVITQSRINRSLDPKDSDYGPNGVHLSHLIGTLIKYNSVNTYVPYLAKSWAVSADQLTWTFTLRKNLTCEDGTEINSIQYKTGLQNALINHSAKMDTPVFSSLAGWKNFMDGSTKEISGIKTPNPQTLELYFERPETGIEDYLSMPYFGFYCSGNFNSNGKWKSPDRIISSGPYRFVNFDSKNDVIEIEHRTNWPLSSGKRPPSKVFIKVDNGSHYYGIEHAGTIVESYASESESINPSWAVLKGTMSMSTNIVLNPFRNLFKDQNARQRIAEFIRRRIASSQDKLRFTYFSNFFYPFSPFKEPIRVNPTISVDELNLEEIVIEDFPVPNERVDILKNIILESSREAGFKKITFKSLDKELSRDQLHAERKAQLDVYLVAVDKGGAAQPWLTKMMFCSELGVRFPDPSGKICSLSKKYEERVLIPEDYSQYSSEFEMNVQNDAAVLPAAHRGQIWLYSKDVNVSALSPTIAGIDFEKIEVQ